MYKKPLDPLKMLRISSSKIGLKYNVVKSSDLLLNSGRLDF